MPRFVAFIAPVIFALNIAAPLLAEESPSFAGAAYPPGGPSLKNDLAPGLGFYEVVRLWGSASDKEEFEARRGARWTYVTHDGTAEVSFENGKVSAWRGKDDAIPETSKKDGDLMDYFKGVETKQPSPEAEAILKEILSEVPSGSPDATSSTITSPPPQPGMAEAIKPIE